MTRRKISQEAWERRLRLARSLGALAKGLAVGALLVIAGFELYAQIGALTAFRYQGF